MLKYLNSNIIKPPKALTPEQYEQQCMEPYQLTLSWYPWYISQCNTVLHSVVSKSSI